MRTAMTAIFTFVLAAAASAAPYHVAFNTESFNGPSPGTVQEFTKTNAAPGVDITFAAMAMIDHVLSPVGTLWWDAGSDFGYKDGFGIVGRLDDPTSYSDDEIEGDERLLLKFSRGVHLLGVNYTDLFNESVANTRDCPAPGCSLEWGAVRVQYIDGTWSMWQTFVAPEANTRSNTNGTLDTVLNEQNVVAMMFASPGQVFDHFPPQLVMLSEYAVGGLIIDDQQTAPVPEPGTIGLVALGLAAVARKKYQRA
jgi:hypothetical protein